MTLEYSATSNVFDIAISFYEDFHCVDKKEDVMMHIARRTQVPVISSQSCCWLL